MEQQPKIAKYFLVRLGLISVSIIGILVGINVYLDIYGLFGDVKNREIPVYFNERISKYLLSYKYIPSNYTTIVAGTSLSDNIHFEQTDSLSKIYNISVMGANISEVKALITNCIERGVENVILCVSPYQFKDVGGKEVEFSDKIYYGAFGSVDLYQTYLVAMIRKLNLMPSKYPKNQINAHGVNDYSVLFEVEDVQGKIHEEAQRHHNEQLNLNEEAVNEFRSLIDILKSKDINFFVYFHPIPTEIFHSNSQAIIDFQNLICTIVNDNSKILDFNQEHYKSFASDYSNYIDHGHLSHKGQKFIASEVNTKISQLFVELKSGE